MTAPGPTVTVSRSWTWTYMRPRAMGWPNLEWTDSWKPARPMIVNPAEITVTVRQLPGGQPEVARCRVKGRWGHRDEHTGRVRVRRLDTPWIGLTLPGRERDFDDRTAAPDWVAWLIADALTRSSADLHVAGGTP